MKKLQLFIFMTIIFKTIIINASSHLSPTKASMQRRNENLLRIIVQQENKNPRSSEKNLLKTWPLHSATKINSSKIDISYDESYRYSSDESKDEFNITQSDDKKIKKIIALYKLNQKIQQLHNKDNSSLLKPRKSDTEPQLSPSYQGKLAKKLLQANKLALKNNENKM